MIRHTHVWAPPLLAALAMLTVGTQLGAGQPADAGNAFQLERDPVPPRPRDSTSGSVPYYDPSRVPAYGPRYPAGYGWSYSMPQGRVSSGVWYRPPIWQRPYPYARRPLYGAGVYYYGGSYPGGYFFYRVW